MKYSHLGCLLALALLSSISGRAEFNLTSSDTTISSLKFIDQYDIPYNWNFKGTTVGGISGIDYDKKSDTYYLISDDRSAINPVRFYTAKIKFTSKGIDTVLFLDTHSLLQSNGQTYPSIKQDPTRVADPEGIRYNPKAKQLVWVNEGERNTKPEVPVLINPSINFNALDGTFAGAIDVPSILTMQTTEKGPRQNGTLEGVTFANNYKTLFASLEEPLFEDGPNADVVANNAWTRIFKFDMASKKNTAQYAYQLEPVANKPNPEKAFKVNGISEILSVGKGKLLTIERSFSTGRLACVIKVFIADLTSADNIIDNPSLKDKPAQHLVDKKLLLNMDDLSFYIDNIEGVTFGPDLPNGHKTLLFVADNNFLILEKMQVLLFEVIP